VAATPAAKVIGNALPSAPKLLSLSCSTAGGYKYPAALKAPQTRRRKRFNSSIAMSNKILRLVSGSRLLKYLSD